MLIRKFIKKKQNLNVHNFWVIEHPRAKVVLICHRATGVESRDQSHPDTLAVIAQMTLH